MGNVAWATNTAKPSKTYAFDILMNTAKLSKLGSRIQLTWVRWVLLEPSKPRSVGFIALANNPENPAKACKLTMLGY